MSCQLFPQHHIRVVRLVERPLQFLQLLLREDGPVPSLPALDRRHGGAVEEVGRGAGQVGGPVGRGGRSGRGRAEDRGGSVVDRGSGGRCQT